MEIAWQRVLPVIVSVLIIIAVAILREYSKTLAAVVSTMPINIPLALWLVYSGGTDSAGLETFARALFINIFPTIGFLLVAWLLVRAGWGLLPVLAASYGAWVVGIGMVLALRQWVGI
jgi:hypothetical protein